MIIFGAVMLVAFLCVIGLAFYLAEIDRRKMVARHHLLIDGFKAVVKCKS